MYTSCNQVGQAHWVPASKAQSLTKHFNSIYLTEELDGVQSGIVHWALVSHLLTGAHKSHVAYRTALSAITVLGRELIFIAILKQNGVWTMGNML